MKKQYKFKDSFFYELWDNILKYLLAVVILIWLFHNGCPRDKEAIHIQEDIIYIKPN